MAESEQQSGGDDRPHPNVRINREIKHPPIAGAKVDAHPEVGAGVYRAVRPALCRVCDDPAEFVITLPGDVVPLCKADYGGDDRR